jgi:tetratricopeptide (TPR) repeat protein
MLNDAVDRTSESQVSLREEAVKVIVSDDAVSPIVMELPPIQVLASLKQISISGVDVPSTVDSLSDDVKAYMSERLERLLVKKEKFRNSATYLTHLGDLAFFSGNLGDAKTYLEDAITLTESAVPRRRLAEVLFCRNEADSAKALLRNSALAGDVESLIWEALILFKERHTREAEAQLKKAIVQDNTNFRARMLLGCIDIAENRFSSAIHNFRIAGSENRFTAALLSNMAVAYLMLHDREKALACLRMAVIDRPQSEGLVVFYADLANQLSHPSEVIAPLKRYLGVSNESGAVWDRLAYAQTSMGLHKEAISSLKSQSAIDNDPGVWNNLALVYWRIGNMERAGEYFLFGLKAVVKKKTFEILANNYVQFLFDNSQFKALVEFVESLEGRVADRVPHGSLSPRSMLGYSMALVELGMLRRAIETTRRLAMSLAPGSKEKLRALTNLSYLLESLAGDREEAVQVAKRIEELLNQNAILAPQERIQAANNVIFSLLESGRTEEAQKLLSMISFGVHSLPHPTATLGLYHFRKGNRIKAEMLYEEAIRMLPIRRDRDRFRQKMYLELARCFAREGDTKSARSFYSRCTKVEAGYETTAKQAATELAQIGGAPQ